MNATAGNSPLPRQLHAEIVRLHSFGLSLLPLDGKRPLTKRWADARLSLSQILGPMNRVPSLAYGIRLGAYAVFDLDVDDPGLVSEIEDRFGSASVHVSSPRGRHLYYSVAEPVRINLRGEGLPVDVKSGPSSYVVGPYSIRPDSGEYLPVKGDLSQTLNTLKVPSDFWGSRVVREGNRHHELISNAIRMVEFVDSPDELTDNLVFFRDSQFERPNDVSDAEVRGAAEWAWGKRLDNAIFAGRNSSFRVPRPAVDALKGLPNASDAIALYTVLTDLHGHNPTKPFALVWASMKQFNHTDLPLKRFRSARNTLIAANLLRRSGNHRAGSRHQTFLLSRVPMGEGLNITYVGRFGPGNSDEAQHG